VNRDRTRAFAEQFRLEAYIRWGKGEEKNTVWLQGNQTYDTAFEALVGAVFLDAQRGGRDCLATVGELLAAQGFFG
jgi:dsRNA-specific ribonuclease